MEGGGKIGSCPASGTGFLQDLQLCGPWSVVFATCPAQAQVCPNSIVDVLFKMNWGRGPRKGSLCLQTSPWRKGSPNTSPTIIVLWSGTEELYPQAPELCLWPGMWQFCVTHLSPWPAETSSALVMSKVHIAMVLTAEVL